MAARSADAALMAASARGDARAFERLYAAHRVRVYRLAYSVLLDREEARDVVQEVFIRLHRASVTWQPRARVSTWLYRVTYNESVSVRRRLKGFVRTAGMARRAQSAEDQAANLEATALVEVSLAGLPAMQRAVVALFLDLELSPAEIADVLGTSANAARVNLHRALDRLRRELRRHGVEVPAEPIDDQIEES